MEEPSLQFILNKPLRGWLRRQGGVMRGWQRKFFVLQDSCLFCFHREDDTKIANTYLLNDYHLKEIPRNADEPDKFAFEIIPEKGNGESVILCASSDLERKEWMKALGYHMYASRGGAIFGLPLEETMKYEHKHGRNIPFIVEACIKHLDAFGMEVEGIFRLAGRAGLLKELRGKFETGQRPALDSVDVHTVGSLLKAYLREMPESLVPPSFYQRAMNCAMRYAEANTDEARNVEVECLTDLLGALPNVKYATLAYICRFLHRLAANSEKTKMNAHNLSLVFGPNLIRHMDNNPELLMLTADLTQHLAYMVIHHCSEILPVRPSLEAIPSETRTDNSVLRNKNPAMNNVATADLLRMSQPVDSKDPSVLAPRPAALEDLMGLDLNRQCSAVSDSSQSPVTPPSPFVFVSDHFDDTSASTSQRGEEEYTLRSACGGMEVSEKRAENNLCSEPRPVPPKRTKSRTLRNRRPPGAPVSPVSPDPPRQLDSKDILTALASASHVTECGDQSPLEIPGHQADVDSSAVEQDKNEVSNSIVEPKSCSDISTRNHSTTKENQVRRIRNIDAPQFQSPECTTALNASDNRSDAGSDGLHGPRSNMKVDLSSIDLEKQVASLKLELVSLKARSERTITALKSQLVDIRSKYETRITSMEKEHQNQVMDLTAKLKAQSTAREEAVEKTMKLQAELYRYKLHYGELHDKAK